MIPSAVFINFTQHYWVAYVAVLSNLQAYRTYSPCLQTSSSNNLTSAQVTHSDL